ncbi:MAG: hypothetical protein U1F55_14760 [Chitinivorax sp.]
MQEAMGGYPFLQHGLATLSRTKEAPIYWQQASSHPMNMDFLLGN